MFEFLSYSPPFPTPSDVSLSTFQDIKKVQDLCPEFYFLPVEMDKVVWPIYIPLYSFYIRIWGKGYQFS